MARDLQWASPITHSKSDLSIPILVPTMEFREVFCRKMVGYEELHNRFMNDVLSTHLFPNRPGARSQHGTSAGSHSHWPLLDVVAGF